MDLKKRTNKLIKCASTCKNSWLQQGEDGEKKFDPTGYDKDLVENLERDIVQKNPNVSW